MNKLITLNSAVYDALREVRDKDHLSFSATVEKLLVVYGNPSRIHIVAMPMPTHSDK